MREREREREREKIEGTQKTRTLHPLIGNDRGGRQDRKAQRKKIGERRERLIQERERERETIEQ